MKKAFFSLILACTLSFSGCSRAESISSPKTSPTSEAEISQPAEEDVEQMRQLMVLRLIDGAESGNLVLAGELPSDVYTMPDGSYDVLLDGKAADSSILEDGMEVDILWDGDIAETFPVEFPSSATVSVTSQSPDTESSCVYPDLCGFYLQVLEDLWETDSGLNENIQYLSLDLQNAPGNLTEGEKTALAWIFASKHQAEPLTLSYEKLSENGYLTVSESGFQEWKDGILFSISSPQKCDSLLDCPTLQFQANKWRSSLGAYAFEDCTSIPNKDGKLRDYQIGSEMIS